MPKFETIRVGEVLPDIHSERAGNTMMRRLGCWDVRIISIDAEKRTAVASWNGNPPRVYFEHELKRLRRKKSKAYLEQQLRIAQGHWS